MSKTRHGDAAAMARLFHDARLAICALEGRQKLWQDSISQDAEARLEAHVGHRVEPLACLNDEELTAAIEVAEALEGLRNALDKAMERFSGIEPRTAPPDAS